MKPRADENEQPQVSTYLFNIPLTDKPLEFTKGMTKKRLEKLLDECAPKGEELVHALLRIASVRKVNISGYEVEVIYTELQSGTTRRATITALMKAVGGTLKMAPEHLIVTTDASRGEDIKPFIDPPMYED